MKKHDEAEWKVISYRIESSCKHHLLTDLLSSCEYVVVLLLLREEYQSSYITLFENHTESCNSLEITHTRTHRYEIQISARNKHGWGSYSKVQSVRTMAVPRPSQPRLTMRRLDSVMKVSWNPPARIPSHVKLERYELQIRRHDQDVTVWTVLNDAISGDQHSEIIDDLESARKYIFRVRAFTSVGQSQFSLPSQPMVTRRAL